MNNVVAVMQLHGGLSRQSQRGAALIVALLILVIISIIGVAAMRTSIFNSKIATSAQAGTMSFQAAESALAGVLNEAETVSTSTPGHVIGSAITSLGLGSNVVQNRCVTAADTQKSGTCAAADYMDSRDLVKSSSRTVVKGKTRAKLGEQVSLGGTRFAYYDFVTVAEGGVEVMNIKNFNVQEYEIVGIVPEGDY